ncbi:hypothetical protein [Geobacter benzoatilyticus]|uniref:Uncharacterized protein n=1 Tax=Geobacter benzoatilyticus TaxID=2815309 RepID=A0ABX7Q2I3_9BACT|nr:hypothetical protein [Geobacter benzoatilyticus]QSV45407.1 hypothetical protein JZM60_15000 [Geobacter benzoatilyticus]
MRITKLLILFLIASFSVTISSTFAAEKKSKKAKTVAKYNLPDDPTPFGFVFGKTTIEEAQTLWEKEGGKVDGSGYGEAKPSYGDNDPDGVANKDVVLVDISKLPLDQLQTARFGFINDKLYLIRYQMGGDFDKIAQQLAAKYGQPAGTDSFMSDKKYTWDFKTVILQLQQDFFSKHKMVFLSKKLVDEVDKSNKRVYAEHIRSKAQTQKGF